METDDKSNGGSWLLDSDTDARSVARYYDDWASRYDEELGGWDYRSPAEAARLLASYADPGSRVLDAGCGTGLSGRALAAAGFRDAVGIDISAESLEIAARRGVYSQVLEVDLQALPFPFAAGGFDALTCVGVMTYVDDTAATLGEFCRIVRPGGHVVFTCRDDLYHRRGYPKLLAKLVSAGRWRGLYQSPPSPYLPGNEDFAEKIRVINFVYEVL